MVVFVRLKDGETILKHTVNATNLKLWMELSSPSSSPKDQSGVPRKKSSPTLCRQRQSSAETEHSTPRKGKRWILLISFGYTEVDFVVGGWILWILLFRQTANRLRV